MSILIKSRYLITNSRIEENSIYEDMGIYIEKDTISEIGDFKTLKEKYPSTKIIGNGKQLIMPGFIDAHSHGQGLSYFQKGMEYDYLENSLLDWAMAPSIDPELDVMLNSIKHIQSGCTTIHHNDSGKAFDRDVEANTHKKIRGYKNSGIRLAYSPGVKNINSIALEDKKFYDTLPKDMQDFVKPMIFIDNEQVTNDYFDLFTEIYNTYNSENLKIILGPMWVQGSTDEFLLKVKEKSQELGNLPIHIHTLQTPIQKAFGIRNYGKSLVGHLNDLGLVEDNLVLGHAVFLDEEDIKLMAEKNASTTHHPSCNFWMRNGISPVYNLVKEGVNVALGIDNKGISDDEDIIMEMRMAYLLHRVSSFDLGNTPALGAFDIINMATTNAAKVCGFDDIGTIEIGKKADIILIDLDRIMETPWISPDLNIAEIFIHRGKGTDVNTVIVGGEIIMKDRKILTVDVDQLYSEIREQMSKGIDDRQRAYAEKLQLLKPYYQKWYSNWVSSEDLEPYYIMNSKI